MVAPKDSLTEGSGKSTKPTQRMADLSDPDEDDLDDLDDILDEFSAAKPDSKRDAPEASGPGRPNTQSSTAPVEDTSNEFSKQLQQEMAALMGEIDDSPEMRQQMEAMLKELSPDVGSKVGHDDAKPNVEREFSSSRGAGSSAPDEGFQETIRKTIERMQVSGDQAAAAAASNENDILAKMLKEMQSGGLDDTASEEDFLEDVNGYDGAVDKQGHSI